MKLIIYKFISLPLLVVYWSFIAWFQASLWCKWDLHSSALGVCS